MLGSIDANTGSPDLGWDTDQFPMDIRACTAVMQQVLRQVYSIVLPFSLMYKYIDNWIIMQNGLAPGGLNFDAKVRRESTNPQNLFIAHIGAMDSFARELRNAAKIAQDGIMERNLKVRYCAHWFIYIRIT